MIRGGERRGQFFLLAAVIIITGIVAIASIRTFVTEPGGDSTERIYDLSQEVGYESARVIDHGVYNNAYTKDFIEGWLGNYTEYAKNREGVGEWLFIYGNSTEITVVNFTIQSSGDLSTNIGGRQVTTQAGSTLIKERSIYPSPSNRIIVRDTLGIERDFNLGGGENFYFVVAKVENDGVIIEEND